jgi:hypothetical protein
LAFAGGGHVNSMKLTLITAAVAAAAVLAATAVAAPSGDTCTYTSSANGTYTLTIVTGAGIQHNGFAFHAPGLTIKTVGIPGRNGNAGLSSMPPGATGNWAGWTSDESLTGYVNATLTVDGNATGPVVVEPFASPPSSTLVWYDAVTCQGSLGAQTVSFFVKPNATWSATKHGWLLAVTVPTGGTVSAEQPVPTTAKPVPTTISPHALVQVHRVSTAAGRAVTLTVKATSRGQAELAKTGVLHVKLNVTFDAKDGREGHKTISLTLRK